MSPFFRNAPAVLAFAFQLASVPGAIAQQLEPRAYSNLPVGLKFLLGGYAHSRGDVLLDPTVPVTNVSANVDTLVLGYVRSLDLWGKSGSVGLVLPYARISAQGDVGGAGVERDAQRNGRSGAAPRHQSARGARALSGKIPRVPAGHHRRSEPRGERPVGAIRRNEARQHRHQPLVVQARDRRVPGARRMDPGRSH